MFFFLTAAHTILHRIHWSGVDGGSTGFDDSADDLLDDELVESESSATGCSTGGPGLEPGSGAVTEGHAVCVVPSKCNPENGLSKLCCPRLTQLSSEGVQ